MFEQTHAVRVLSSAQPQPHRSEMRGKKKNLKSDYESFLADPHNKIENIFKEPLYNEDANVKTITNILKYLYSISNIDLILTSDKLPNKKIVSIKKINTLSFEEKPFDLSNSNPDEDALIYASVWMFQAKEANNKMFYSDRYKTIKKSNNVTSTDIIDITDIPFSTGPHYLGDTYQNKFTETIQIKDRVDKKSLPNQVYINNDQVQYFNTGIERLKSKVPGLENLIHMSAPGSNNPQHVFRVFGVNLHKEQILDQVTDLKLKELIKISSTKKFYYSGIQVSSELNSLFRRFSNGSGTPNPVNNFKKHIILKNLFIVSLMYSQYINYNEDDLSDFFEAIDNEWNETYGKNKPNMFTEIKDTPINETFGTIFPITLRYKEATIEMQNDKKIFNLGDSNTTVNFFSGTGLNTGILNVKKILTDYKHNLSEEQVVDLNKKYKKSNRRTVYNSLLSSQNPSVLSVTRIFEMGATSYGPFKKNISLNTIKDIDDIISAYNFDTDLNDVTGEQNGRMVCIVDLFKSFNKFFTEFVLHENTYMNQDKTDPNFSKANIDDTSSDYHIIYKTLKWNLFVCLYNLVNNPVLGSNDYKQESISYLNNMIFNYSDFCNFNRNEENKDYFCDILQTETEYNPTRSEGLLISTNFTT